jgi:hypothetical protein
VYCSAQFNLTWPMAMAGLRNSPSWREIGSLQPFRFVSSSMSTSHRSLLTVRVPPQRLVNTNSGRWLQPLGVGKGKHRGSCRAGSLRACTRRGLRGRTGARHEHGLGGASIGTTSRMAVSSFTKKQYRKHV